MPDIYGKQTVIADDPAFRVSVWTAPANMAGHVMIKVHDSYATLDASATSRLLFALVRALPIAVKEERHEPYAPHAHE